MRGTEPFIFTAGFVKYQLTLWLWKTAHEFSFGTLIPLISEEEYTIPPVSPIIPNNECQTVNNVVEFDESRLGPCGIAGVSHELEVNASLTNPVVSTTTPRSDTISNEQPELSLENDYPNKTGHNLKTNGSISIL